MNLLLRTDRITRLLLFIVVIFYPFSNAYMQENDLYTQGVKLFAENKPEEARVILEAVNSSDPKKPEVYLYLGVIYEQLGQREKSVQILQRGIQSGSGLKDMMYFNIGNSFYMDGKNTLAVEMYNQALAVNASYSNAYLNRANAYLRLEDFQNAKDDYVLYLQLDPRSSQRDDIERLIALLSEQIAAEARAAEDEAQRLADEEARRKELLNQVLNSLDNAGEDTTNIGVDSEDIEEVERELEVDD
jgi:tetratricopeptide (TPR) repeat protein